MTLHHFIGSAIVILVISYLAVGFSRRLGLGSMLGLLTAGTVLGPSGFNVTESAEGLREFAELGVVFLLFVIGLQLNPSKLWGMRRDVLGLGLAQLVVTGGALALFLRFCGAHAWSHAALGGLILSLSSTAFVVQLLEDRKELKTDHGQTSFAVLLAQDLAAIPLLALVSIVAHRDGVATAALSLPLLLHVGLVTAVLMALSQREGIIGDEAASVGVLSVSVTMALTPLLARLADAWGRRVERLEGVWRPPAPLAEAAEPMVIVGGFGRCGEAVAAFLRERNIPFAALELNWDRVIAGQQRGYPVSVGDMTDHTVLRNAGAARCRLLVIASNDDATAARAILAFRLLAPPATPIVVQAQDRVQAERLKMAGASHLVVEFEHIGQRLMDSVSSALRLIEIAAAEPKIRGH